MKKIIALLLALILAVSLASCGGSDDGAASDQSAATPDEFKPVSLGGTIITLEPDVDKASTVTAEQMEIMKAFVEAVVNDFGKYGKTAVTLDPASLQITVRSDDVFTDDELDAMLSVPMLTFRNDEGEVLMNGTCISSAEVSYATYGNLEPLVLITLNAEGARLFAEITEENIGRQLGIYLNDMMLSLPRVHDTITDGKTQISGVNTPEEAERLAALINAGTLSFRLRILSVEGNRTPVQYSLSEIEVTSRTVLFKDTLGWADGEGEIYCYCYVPTAFSYDSYSYSMPYPTAKKMHLLQEDHIYHCEVPDDTVYVAFGTGEDFAIIPEDAEMEQTAFAVFDGCIHDYQPTAQADDHGTHELTSWCGLGISKYSDYSYYSGGAYTFADADLIDRCRPENTLFNESVCITEYAQETYPDSVGFVLRNNSDQPIEDIYLLVTAYDSAGSRTALLPGVDASDVITLRSFDLGAQPGAAVTLLLPCDLSGVSYSGIRYKVIGYTSGGVSYVINEEEIDAWVEQQQAALPEYPE